jgi:methyltransferase family protein
MPVRDEELIVALFRGMLDRNPTQDELRRRHDLLRDGWTFFDLYSAIVGHPEFQARHRVKTVWPPGHFYSPVVDPATVDAYVTKARQVQVSEIYGIDLNVDEMALFWTEHQAFIAATPFRKEPDPDLRYYWGDSPYPIGDAVTYRAKINALRPRHIIEIGSGFSTACALDTLDEIGQPATRLTCIEPYPTTLIKRVRPEDRERLTIIESPVQEVPVQTFSNLEANDILFIDSTHVLKTGSDVHYEFFSILPILKPGVMVHFHDIRWPFEYPHQFIFERNYSWNEAYGLRALLMYSSRFSIAFYNSLFAVSYPALARETFADFMINPGSSIWLRVLK